MPGREARGGPRRPEAALPSQLTLTQITIMILITLLIILIVLRSKARTASAGGAAGIPAALTAAVALAVAAAMSVANVIARGARTLAAVATEFDAWMLMDVTVTWCLYNDRLG